MIIVMNVIPFYLTPTLYYVHINFNITTRQKYEILRRKIQQHISNHTLNIVSYFEAYMTISKERFASAVIEHIYMHL
jgi:hypothetical protein